MSNGRFYYGGSHCQEKVYRRAADAEPTCTSRVTDALIKADDFLTAKRLQEITGCNMNQVSAALYHLNKSKAIESLTSNDTLFWFATPEQDVRHYQVLERVKEESGHRKRRQVVVVTVNINTKGTA